MIVGNHILGLPKKTKLNEVLSELTARHIPFKKYEVKGPMPKLKTAGAEIFSLREGKHTFIDTEGGVTFLFSLELETYQVCKYYNIVS